MYTFEEIRVDELLLDPENVRLGGAELANQQETMLSITERDPSHMVALADSIVEQGGLDPLTMPGVVALPGSRKKYLVVEGNRRVTALKALENPSLILPALKTPQVRKLRRLATKYEPIETIRCVLFDSIEAASYWVTLRHTGQNKGAGLVEWGAPEQDNWRERMGIRTHFKQMMDFVEKYGSGEAKEKSAIPIKTNLERLVGTIQDNIGLERRNRVTYTTYPPEELAKPLSYVVAKLKSGEINVDDIRNKEDRERFLRNMPPTALPDPSTKYLAPVPIDDFTFDRAEIPTEPPKKSKKKRKKKRTRRSSLIPADCNLNIERPRVNHIYVELSTMSHHEFTEATSVLLRVFLELSMDHYIDVHNLIPDAGGLRRNTVLAKKLKVVAEELHRKGSISQKLKEAIEGVADESRYLLASVATFHQYIHNMHVNPVASELEDVWDVTLQPFLEKVFA